MTAIRRDIIAIPPALGRQAIRAGFTATIKPGRDGEWNRRASVRWRRKKSALDTLANRGKCKPLDRGTMEGRLPSSQLYMWRATGLLQVPAHLVEPPTEAEATEFMNERRVVGAHARRNRSPPRKRPDCGDDRSCGGDRRRRSDRIDVGRGVGLGG